MSIGRKFYNSLTELKNIYSLATIAMLLALRVVLGIFGNTTLAFFENSVKISGAFLPIAVCGAMFGPVAAGLVGGLGDLLSYILCPSGGYFPGFSLSGVMTGVIFGLFFYKNKVTLPRTILAWSVNALTVETFVNALWLYLLMGTKGYLAFLTTRFISVGVKCVPEILLILALGKLACKIKLPNRLKN